jgi:hypothetical protein
LFRRRKELIPEIVYVHGDNFTPTEWEAQFSDLAGSGDEQSFAPVVDDNFRVVGHLGWIDGNNICVPKKTIASGYGYPYAAELEKARLFGAHRRLVSSHYSRLPGLPGQPVSAAPTKRPAPCWPANKPPALSLPNPKDEEALWDSLLEAPGKDVSEEQRHLGNLNFFLAGGGKAVVGFRFGWNLVPREQWQVRQHRDYPVYSYPFDTYLMLKGYRFQVLVAPDGHIQAVLGVEKYEFELREEKILRIAFKIIDIALTVWMIIDIATIPVALFRLGGKLLARDVMIETVKMTVNQEAKAAADLTAREVAEAALRRGAMSGPERAEATTAWAKLKREFWEAGNTPPMKTFTEDEAAKLNKQISDRMTELGIPKKNQGAGIRRLPPKGEKPPPGTKGMQPFMDENGKAFNPTGSTRGGRMRSGSYDPRYGGDESGISVHGNVFNDWKGFELWNKSSVADRIDATIAHEWSEFNELSHWETAQVIPETKLAISQRAKELLRYMRMMGEPDVALTEFTKAEWEAIKAAGKATAPFEEKLKIAMELAAQGK